MCLALNGAIFHPDSQGAIRPAADLQSPHPTCNPPTRLIDTRTQVNKLLQFFMSIFYFISNLPSRPVLSQTTGSCCRHFGWFETGRLCSGVKDRDAAGRRAVDTHLGVLVHLNCVPAVRFLKLLFFKESELVSAHSPAILPVKEDL